MFHIFDGLSSMSYCMCWANCLTVSAVCYRVMLLVLLSVGLYFPRNNVVSFLEFSFITILDAFNMLFSGISKHFIARIYQWRSCTSLLGLHITLLLHLVCLSVRVQNFASGLLTYRLFNCSPSCAILNFVEFGCEFRPGGQCRPVLFGSPSSVSLFILILLNFFIFLNKKSI